MLIYKGIIIDTFANAYKSYYKLFGIMKGKWIQIHEPDYISIYSTSESGRRFVLSASTLHVNSFYKINLFYNTNEHIELYRTEKKDEAIILGQKLKAKLHIDLYDADDETWL